MDFSEAYPDTCSTAARAARVGDVDSLQKLIDRGKPVDVKDNRGWISLHEAAYNGHVDCLKLILQQDDSLVDFRTFQEETALMLACRSASHSCVQHLIAAGADAKALNSEGYCPLWEATVSGNLECVRNVVSAWANLNAQIFTGDTSLHHAVKHGHVEIVRCLLEAGADITVQTENEITPLFLAAQFGQLNCMKMLVEEARKKGDDFLINYVNMQARYDATPYLPLFLFEYMKKYLPARDNATPLQLAALEGHADCVDLLLKVGADPNRYAKVDAMPVIDTNPLQAAVYSNRLGCVKLLIQVTDMGPMFSSNKRPFLLPTRPPAYRYQPLYLAMRHKEPDCLRILISHGYLRQYQKSFMAETMTMGSILGADIEIKPVVTFIKCCQKWLHKQNMKDIRHKFGMALFVFANASVDVLVALLRSGMLCDCVLKRNRENVRDKTKRLLLLCAHFNHEACMKTTGEHQRQSCVHLTNNKLLSPRDWEKLDISLVLKLLLTPNFLGIVSQLDSVLEQAQPDRGLGAIETSPLPVSSQIRQTLVHCRESFTTLQHICRVNIIYQLLNTNNYTREATLSLPLPQNMQSYLLYEETGGSGKLLVEEAEEMKEVQAKVDKLFEETDVTDLLEHVYQ